MSPDGSFLASAEGTVTRETIERMEEPKHQQELNRYGSIESISPGDLNPAPDARSRTV